MKTRPNPFLSLLRSLALCAAAAGAAQAQTTVQWDGGGGTGNWQSPANWSPDADPVPGFNGTFNNRLNVNGGQALVYTSNEGDTVYARSSDRGLVIGSSALGSGTMTITGGSFSTQGSGSMDIIGNQNSSTGTLTINGGTFIGTNAGTAMGIGTGTSRASVLNVQSGLATIATLSTQINTATIHLSGGTLEINRLNANVNFSNGATTFNLNGGTLRARQDEASFMTVPATGSMSVNVLANGAKIDTQAFHITIGNALLNGTGGGGLTKLGSGSLTLAGASTYTGATTIENGRIIIGGGNNRLLTTGSVVLGAASTSGALVLGDGTARNQTLAGLTATGLGGSVVGGAAEVSTLTLNIGSGGNNFAGVLGGAGANENQLALTKTGSGILSLSGNNTYAGATTISAGAIIKTAADGSTGNIHVANNATFVLAGGVTDGSGQTLTLNGPGNTGSNYFFSGSAVSRGALQAHDGANTWAGDIILTGTSNTRIGVQNGASLTLSGSITESAASGITFRAGGPGDSITLTGAGSWTGTTTLFSNGGAVILGGNNRLSTAAPLEFTFGGTTVLDLNGANQEVAGLFSPSSLGPTGGTITNQGASASTLTSKLPAASIRAFHGVIADGDGTVGFDKSGDGTQILHGASTYTGTTIVSAGTLLVNGSLGNTAVSVGADATFGGTGTIAGSLAFHGDALFQVVDPLVPLSVAGTITFGAGFGIGNLMGLDWDKLDLNTPHIIIATSQSFGTTDISHFGLSNAAPVGAMGRSAYFENGSLAVVVIPEPTPVLLSAIGMLAFFRRKRIS